MLSPDSPAAVDLPSLPTPEEYDSDDAYILELEVLCRELAHRLVVRDELRPPNPNHYGTIAEYRAALESRSQRLLDELRMHPRPTRDQLRKYVDYRLDPETQVPRAILPWVADLREHAEFTLRCIIRMSLEERVRDKGRALTAQEQCQLVRDIMSKRVAELGDRENLKSNLVPNTNGHPLVVVVFRLSGLAYWNKWGSGEGDKLVRDFARLINERIADHIYPPPPRNDLLTNRGTLYRVHDMDEEAHFTLVFRGSLEMLGHIIVPVIHDYAKLKNGDDQMKPSVSYGACEIAEILKFIPHYYQSYALWGVPREIPVLSKLIVDLMERVARRRAIMATTRSQLLHTANVLAEDPEAHTRNIMNWKGDGAYFTLDDLLKLSRAPMRSRHGVLQEIMARPEMQARLQLIEQPEFWGVQNPDFWMIKYHVHCIAARISWNVDVNKDAARARNRIFPARR